MLIPDTGGGGTPVSEPLIIGVGEISFAVGVGDLTEEGVGVAVETTTDGAADGVSVPDGVASSDSPNTRSPLFIRVNSRSICTTFPFASSV